MESLRTGSALLSVAKAQSEDLRNQFLFGWSWLTPTSTPLTGNKQYLPLCPRECNGEGTPKGKGLFCQGLSTRVTVGAQC